MVPSSRGYEVRNNQPVVRTSNVVGSSFRRRNLVLNRSVGPIRGCFPFSSAIAPFALPSFFSHKQELLRIKESAKLPLYRQPPGGPLGGPPGISLSERSMAKSDP